MNDTLVRELSGIALGGVGITATIIDPMSLSQQAIFFAAFGALAGSYIRQRSNKKKFNWLYDMPSFFFTVLISFYTTTIFADPLYLYIADNWLTEPYKTAHLYNGTHLIVGATVYPVVETTIIIVPEFVKKKILERSKK